MKKETTQTIIKVILIIILLFGFFYYRVQYNNAIIGYEITQDNQTIFEWTEGKPYGFFDNNTIIKPKYRERNKK